MEYFLEWVDYIRTQICADAMCPAVWRGAYVATRKLSVVQVLLASVDVVIGIGNANQEQYMHLLLIKDTKQFGDFEMANTTIRSRWSISSSRDSQAPLLTSLSCYDALVDFFQNGSSFLLAVTTESSSHPTGLDSLRAQPWVYAGGGLGNMDECPMQVCLAGGTKQDSLTFASVCMIPECDAYDLAAEDFPARLQIASFQATETKDSKMITEYVQLHERIAQVNKFLKTGWVCGEYKVDWEIFPSIIYIGVSLALIALCCKGTFFRHKATKDDSKSCTETQISDENGGEEIMNGRMVHNGTNERKFSLLTSCIPPERFWSAWDMSKHLTRICVQRPETSCLDGLKFGSILWIISGHVMAIQSSSGPGYLNPREFLPPTGVTTTLFGQLLFSSRFAVDTFLCISGYLAVRVLKRKLHPQPRISEIFSVLAFRIIRILPLYLMCMGFWILVAPHLGSGPFWYQWENFLEPCRRYWWTNIMFLNNFLPWSTPTTNTCFYHSWYLAVDVQLFFIFAPWLVILYRRNDFFARKITLFLWCASVILTAVLAYKRRWSMNTFDGAAVALFDIEGYAKPHVRAQSYLSGMLVAMIPHTRERYNRNSLAIALCVLGLALMAFVTVTGAYSRRACNFEELPFINDCGSTWNPWMTFLFTAFSRAVWSICIAIIMHLCLERRGGAVGTFLSWRIWTPLAKLSFGAYLIHPIVIYVWQLGGREKITFSLFSFLMDFTSVSVVSFVFSAVAALLIEFPFSSLLRPPPIKREGELESLVPIIENDLVYQYNSYGATGRNDEQRA